MNLHWMASLDIWEETKESSGIYDRPEDKRTPKQPTNIHNWLTEEQQLNPGGFLSQTG